jgi:hypothetical protein
MESTLDKKIKGMPVPVVSAHAGGKGTGRENRLETIQESLKHPYDEIEIDVRKSKDGVLYCHHGSVPFGVIFSQVLNWFTYVSIVNLLGQTNCLSEIVPVIPKDVGLYLDIKESSVTAADLNPILRDCRAARVWIACYSYKQLLALGRELDPEYIYVYNTPYLSVSKASRLGEQPDVIANTIPQLLLEYLPKSISRRLAYRIHSSMPIWLTHQRGSHEYFVFKKWLWVAYDTPEEMSSDTLLKELRQKEGVVQAGYILF